MELGDLSNRGSQYVSIRYAERLTEARIEPSVGSHGDSYDNALAESINGLYKAEVIHHQGPWKSIQAVERRPLNGRAGSIITACLRIPVNVTAPDSKGRAHDSGIVTDDCGDRDRPFCGKVRSLCNDLLRCYRKEKHG